MDVNPEKVKQAEEILAIFMEGVTQYVDSFIGFTLTMEEQDPTADLFQTLDSAAETVQYCVWFAIQQGIVSPREYHFMLYFVMSRFGLLEHNEIFLARLAERLIPWLTADSLPETEFTDHRLILPPELFKD